MFILAKRGDTLFLCSEIENPKHSDFEAKGVTINIESGKKSKPIGIQQVLKWGYWEEATKLDTETIGAINKIYNS